jgi:hypothetical protein
VVEKPAQSGHIPRLHGLNRNIKGIRVRKRVPKQPHQLDVPTSESRLHLGRLHPRSIRQQKLSTTHRPELRGNSQQR